MFDNLENSHFEMSELNASANLNTAGSKQEERERERSKERRSEMREDESLKF